MIDETTPPDQVQDTAGLEDPSGTPSDAQNWEKRYSDLQPEYTRATQEAARLREEKDAAEQTAYAWQIYTTSDDPDLKRQAAEALGLEPDEPEYQDDGLSAYEKRIAALEERDNAREQAAKEAAEQEATATFVGQAITKLVEESGENYSDKDMKVLYGLALLETDEQGNLNPQAAWDLFQEVRAEARESVLKGKRNVPRPASGVDASKKPDLSTRAGRLSRAEEILAAQQLE